MEELERGARAICLLKMEKIGAFSQICYREAEIIAARKRKALKYHPTKVYKLCLVVGRKVTFHHHSAAVGLRELE